MKTYIEERTLELAKHISQTGETIRQTAKKFCLSKSTVHNDLSKRLKILDPILFEEVEKILDEHFAQKHIKGGQSTKNKYLKKIKK